MQSVTQDTTTSPRPAVVTSVKPIAPEAKVSVIIPVYNAEAFLEEMLRSVLGQSFIDFVIMVVNDGSTDASAETLERVQDRRLFVAHQANSGGPARPRNVGVALTSGEYVALFDADDIMEPEKLSLSVSVLDDCSDAGFVFSDLRVVDQHGNELTKSFLRNHSKFQDLVASSRAQNGYVYIPQKILFATLCKENFIASTSVVVRRSILESVGGFDEQLKNSEDRDLWFKLARSCGAAYIPRALQQYRRWPGSIEARDIQAKILSRIVVLRRQIDAGVTAGERRDLLDWISSNYASLGYAERRAGRHLASVFAFVRAFAVAPKISLVLAAGKSAAHIFLPRQ